MTGAFGPLTRGEFPVIMSTTGADHTTQPFWDAAREERLVAPRCTECGRFRLPPSPFCSGCRSRSIEWVELPGTATLYSFTVVRHPLHPDLAEACPYVSGVVELDGTQGAGARLIVNVVDCDPDAVRIGDRLEVAWVHVNDEMTLPKFRPLTEAQP